MPPQSPNKTITLAVDVMGSDRGVRPLLKGLSDFIGDYPDVRFLIFGQKDKVSPALKKLPKLKDCIEIRHCDEVVSMDDKPSQVMRHGKGTSMYAAVESVKSNEADVAISCGNTGALMALSMLILRKAPLINRPAIAVLWPSSNKQQFNIMLDGGADVKADAKDLHQFAVMGASFARNLYALDKPRIGLLNVGTEEGKGRAELSEAATLIENGIGRINGEYVGFVEGADLLGNRVDVIVTDGFTGNIALKTGEGVARFIRSAMSDAFRSNLLARLGAIFAYPAIRAMSKKMDPRRSNGGVFLGLGGTVIKSHGGSYSVSMYSAIQMAYTLADSGFYERMNTRLKTALEESEGATDE